MTTPKITDDGRMDTRGMTDDEAADAWRACIVPALRALADALENGRGAKMNFPEDSLDGHAILIATPTIDQDGDEASMRLVWEVSNSRNHDLIVASANAAAASKAKKMQVAK